MKIKITHTSYPPTIPNGTIMTVTSKEPNGAVNATLDGDDFEWFISAGRFYVVDDIKLEVGKTYELNNGEVHVCEKMRGDNPLAVDHFGYGPFYHQDGRFADCGADYELSVKRCVSVDKPKTWRDMTDAEKGALLLAKHEGKVIEVWAVDEWLSPCTLGRYHGSAYRVKPEPVRETVDIKWPSVKEADVDVYGSGMYKITFDTVDGSPDTSSIRMDPVS